MPVVPAALLLLACVSALSFARKARGCGLHPAFPAPSDFKRVIAPAGLGHFMPREREVMCSLLAAASPILNDNIFPSPRIRPYTVLTPFEPYAFREHGAARRIRHQD